MTRKRMLLLIIGSLITVSTAVGVGVNFAIGSGFSQGSSSFKIDTPSPITKDGEETNVIDKEKDKSLSTPPAKIEINDKRKVSTPTKVDENKDKQNLANKQTTPPTNSPIVVRKEGGTSDTNNKGTQLIIGDVSKLNLPQKENKEESKDSQSKPAVVIIKDTPTPPQTKEVEKNKEQSNPDEQKLTGAPVVVVGKPQPQPQQTSPQQKEEKEITNKSNEQQTQGEGSQQGSEVQVEVPKGQEDNQKEVIENQKTKEEATPSDNAESNPDTTDSAQVELIDNNTQQQNEESIETKPTLTESQTKILKTIDDFKNIKDSDDLNTFMETHIIRPDEADLFFANIPAEWFRDPNKRANLGTFWVLNKRNISEGLAKDYWTTKSGREQANIEFNKYLGLVDTGELNGKIISAGNSFIVKGAPNRSSDPDTP